MFTQPAPSSPGASLPLATSSTRGSRLRDFINIRNYTQSHLLSREPPLAAIRPIHDIAAVPSASSSPRRHNPIRSRSLIPSTTAVHDCPLSPEASHNSEGPSAELLGSTNSRDGALERASRQPPSTESRENTVEPLSRSRTVPDRGDHGFETAMTRTRSATTDDPSPEMLPSIRFSAFYDPRSNRPSLSFTPMSRTLPTGKEVIKVGRYSERENHTPIPANAPSAAPVGFKSKVVSRRHCEFWFEDGKWYIRDVKSSSGTFLNHIRLSAPGTESKPFPINDGDIVQLGIDFKGGEEMIYRCVKMRIELNRGWQAKPNSFNCIDSVTRTRLFDMFECYRYLDAEVDEPSDEWQQLDSGMEDAQEERLERSVPQLIDSDAPSSGVHASDRDTPESSHGGIDVGDMTVHIDPATLARETPSRHVSSDPVPIPNSAFRRPSAGRSAALLASPRGARTPSPEAHPTIGITGGPLTPRNDAGPWVFDGNPARVSEDSSRRPGMSSLNAAAQAGTAT
ncbi:hypothetical protein DL764_000890 [Monosporascus ibericus]|uniref:FHA domain-containing protein n=1 Tax=Monosporascus ibericus TaxID=155417 RepID=A0A4V1XCK8_9PEZI|nr:hypothetical protein DL764_000890 [Monosporascus ibericus]